MQTTQKLSQLLNNIPTWLLTGVTLALMLYLTLWPNPLPEDNVPAFPGADKIAHAIMFGGLVLVMMCDFAKSIRRTLSLQLLLSLAAAAALLGGVIEILQWSMALGREGDWADFVADTVGAFLALLAARWVEKLVMMD